MNIKMKLGNAEKMVHPKFVDALKKEGWKEDKPEVKEPKPKPAKKESK